MNLSSISPRLLKSYFQTCNSLKNLCFLFVLGLLAFSAQAQTWTGAVNSDWDNAANWQGGLPLNSDFVFINPTPNDPEISGSVTLIGIQVNMGATLTVKSGGTLNLHNTNTGTLAILDVYQGTVVNNGTINITSAGSEDNGILNDNGIFTNESTTPGGNVSTAIINIDGIAGDGIRTSGTFTNQDGVINIGQSGSIGDDGIFVDGGSFSNIKTLLTSPIAITIDDTGGDGIDVGPNAALAHGAGFIRIGENNAIEKRGIRVRGEFLASGPIIIASAGGDGIYIGDNGSMTSSFSISIGTVSTVGDMGLESWGTFTNNGTIDIQRATERGVLNVGTMENKSGAVLIIGSAEKLNNNGLSNFGSFVNRGTIYIQKTKLMGLSNTEDGTFSNLSNATIHIGTQNGSIGEAGILNEGIITNNASTIYVGNTGEVLANAGWGLSNQSGATFNNINGATLVLGQSGKPVKSFGVVVKNSSIFQNSASTLKIDNLKGFFSSDGNAISVQSNGTFDNINGGVVDLGQGSGGIKRNGFDIFGGGTVTNIGSTINIDKTSSSGFKLTQTSEFLNSNNGQVNIGQNGGSGSIGAHGVNNQGNAQFINNGASINIDNTDGNGILHSSTITFVNNNNGQIIIGENGGAENIGGNAIFNRSDFSNSDGTVSIANTIGNGIENSTGGNFENINNGQINIGLNGGTNNIGSTGIRNEEVIFTNNGGTINIENASTYGIHCLASSQLDNINNGQVSVSNTQSGVFITDNSSGTNDGSMTIDTITSSGNFVNSGILNIIESLLITNTSTVSGNGTYNVEGNWINNGAFTPGNSTVNMVGSSASELKGSVETAFNLLTIEKDNNSVLVAAETSFSTIQDLYVEDGHLLTESGVTLSVPAFYVQPNARLTNNGHIDTPGRLELDGIISGDGIYEAGGIFLTGFNVDYDETASSTVLLSGPNAAAFGTLTNHEVNKLIIDKDNPSTLVTQAEFSFSCKEFELESGTFVQNDNLFADNVLIESSGTWNDCSLSLDENLVNNGQLDGGVLNLNSDTETELSGNPFTIDQLRTNKSGQGSESLISTDINVTDKVIFNPSYTGRLNIGASSTVTLQAGATIENESGTRYFTGMGTLQTTVSLSAPNSQNPGNIGVEISSNANLGPTIIRRYHQSHTINGQQSISRYYDISPANNNGLDATVEFHYHDHELNGWAESGLAAYRFNGSEWELYSATQVNTAQNFVEVQGIDAFSIWTMASSSLLPVKLTYFSARKEGEDALLEWQTVSETNNEGFEIEHSSDGRNWDYLDFVDGQGTSTEWNDYTFLHKSPTPGMNYYRLRQVDFDGQWEYSETRSVKFDRLNGQIKLFPNPASSRSNIQITDSFETVDIKVFDLTGRVIFERKWEGGEGTLPIDVSGWKSGQYLIYIEMDGRGQSHKLIVTSK